MSKRSSDFPSAVELYLSFCPPLDIIPCAPEPAASVPEPATSVPEPEQTLVEGDILELESLMSGSWDGDVEELLDTIPGV